MKTVVAKFLIFGMAFLAISPIRAAFDQEAEKKLTQPSNWPARVWERVEWFVKKLVIIS